MDKLTELRYRKTRQQLRYIQTEFEETKIIYIQPWEFRKVPFEWQYKFETFSDMLCVHSNYEKEIFIY